MRILSSLLATVFMAAAPMSAWAAVNCVSTPPGNGVLNATQLGSLLAGRTACLAKAGGGWQNQEQHSGSAVSGTIIDYKKGPTDPRDPTKTIGAYTIGVDGGGVNGRVTYTYTGSGTTFPYFVLGNSSSSTLRPGIFSFCPTLGSNAGAFEITVKAGLTSC